MDRYVPRLVFKLNQSDPSHCMASLNWIGRLKRDDNPRLTKTSHYPELVQHMEPKWDSKSRSLLLEGRITSSTSPGASMRRAKHRNVVLSVFRNRDLELTIAKSVRERKGTDAVPPPWTSLPHLQLPHLIVGPSLWSLHWWRARRLIVGYMRMVRHPARRR